MLLTSMLPTGMVHQASFCFLIITFSGILHAIYRRLAQIALSRARGCQTARSKAPVKDPFLGIDFVYDAFFRKPKDRYLESTHHAFKSLGTTYVVNRWSLDLVYTCDSRNIKHMLASGFDDFALPHLRVSAMETLLGRGIFTLDGSSWHQARSVLKPRFAKLDKDALISTMEQHFQAMLHLVPNDGSPVDLQSLYFRLAMDFASQFLMGNSTCMLGHQAERQIKAQQFVDDYMTCSTEVVKRLGFGPLQHLRVNLRAIRARRRVFQYVDDFIDESLKRKHSKTMDDLNDVLTELAAVTADRKVLRDQVLHLLVASRDTTASVLSNLFFMLARNPLIYKRLREAVLAVAGTTAPTATQLKKMEYAGWCVNEFQLRCINLRWLMSSYEALRLHPVIPTNAREARQDTTIPYGGGADGNSPLFVRKGVVVMYNLYAMHRDERVFGRDPEAFVPERWKDLRPGWAYLPFSGGPRICMGREQQRRTQSGHMQETLTLYRAPRADGGTIRGCEDGADV
ncbi:Cytochrome P450 [Tolypocladium capitatum]|uniref:Cytochrome P450 n=1 Tax=Tolypocladium capitatum TaxID=45235 RepID=A0A2K3Q5Z6_9HYPO|nr:Cytochrome P450 [Tolypocladium capitatum]